jgi:hypothetical protein
LLKTGLRYVHAKDRQERKLCGQAKRALALISTLVLKKDDLVPILSIIFGRKHFEKTIELQIKFNPKSTVKSRISDKIEPNSWI